MFARYGLRLAAPSAVAGAAGSQPGPARPRVLSPEIGADGTVIFRLRAPRARSVRLTSGGDLPQIPPGETLELTKGGDGVWEIALPSVDAGTYRYAFVVDGVNVVDPAQASVSPANDHVWSLFTVRGAPFMDTNDVPHGAVAAVRYSSAALGRVRRMHVYTPPEYGLEARRYPVLYLLHGAFDSDASWSTVGRQSDILDNLIAAGRAVPMIVVMPAGHTGPYTPGAGPPPIDDFVREFRGDIRPYVEKHYSVRTDRRSTAIAGLSMGGAQALEIAIQSLAAYGYVGVLSSGVASIVHNDEWEKRYAAQLDDAAARAGLELVWFAIGKDDFLLERSRRTVAMLERHGFRPEYREGAGGHNWINWREYLNELAPQLFK
jgi:enterochelin esterase family protein